MNLILFDVSSNLSLKDKILQQLNCELGNFHYRQFPDHEDYLQISSNVVGKEVLLLANLHNPNLKILTLIFLASTLRDQGAKKIHLIAPYLPYLRQDKIFKPGESITSKYFAQLISQYFDSLTTIDPHLHRYSSLNDIYSLKCETAHANHEIAKWISSKVSNALLIGPDQESEQWVKKIAESANVEYLIAHKERLSDYQVHITLPAYSNWNNKTPLLIDDIISSGATLLETHSVIKQFSTTPVICLAVHAVFNNETFEKFNNAGIQQIVTCNTIPRPSNAIDISEPLIKALKKNL